ncbi:hypothetical protein [Glycomyces sp. MUSA5-2]|uniref:hypothetical protein n=1 Tax=Glycomyces sp. MUSA5-2 TaxID=2053002 RepID=UPI00300ACD6A
MTRTTTDATEPARDEEPADPADLAELWAAFIRWLLYGIVLAVLPVAVNWMSLQTRGMEASPTAVLGSGELLLVATVLGATATGDLMGARTRRFLVFRTSLTGCTVILMIFASLWYADIAATIRAGDRFERDFTAAGSFAVFVIMVVICACCFVVTRLEDKR